MKYCICILLLMLAIACKTGKNTPVKPDNAGKKPFIPCNVGNYWVYRSSETGRIDTLKVLESKEAAEGGTKVLFNTGEKWLIKGGGDSIYTLCSSRSATEHYAPLYIRADSALYNSCNSIGPLKTSVRLLNEAENIGGKRISGCRFFQIGQNLKVTVCDGIGIVAYLHVFPDGSLNNKKTLIDYNIINASK